MTKTTAATALLGILAASGAIYATQESPACVVATVFLPCADAHALGSTIACDDGETVGIVTVAKMTGDEPGPVPAGWLPVGPETISPVQCADYSFPSDADADRVQVVPTAERYPECLVGEVERLATGEGEFATPALPPYVGTCCAPGCVAAGVSEAIAPGGPRFYECTRLHRLFPDAACGA